MPPSRAAVTASRTTSSLQSTPNTRNPASAISAVWRPRPIATSSPHGRVRGASTSRASRCSHCTTNGEGDIIECFVVPQALLTAVIIGLIGLVTTTVFGLRGADIARHISFGIFSTMIPLLAHSMMMFYLIGKGKAVKDAMAEHSVAGDYYRRIAVVRKPVFSIATLAMAVTM